MNPTYHPEARGLAFNVKCPMLRDMRGTADQRSLAYDRAQFTWWSDAKQAAIRRGFEDIGACGRSGGWAFPIPAVEPYITDDETLARVEALGNDLAEMMGEANERFTAELDAVMDEEAREQAASVAAEVIIGQRQHTEAELIEAVRVYINGGHSLPVYRRIEAALIAYDEARA